MKKIVLTGSNGLLGHELLCKLAASGEYLIYALAQGDISDSSNIDFRNVVHIPVSLADTDFESRLPENPDIIIHLAQSNDFRHFPEKAMDIFDINIRATMRLLDYAFKTGCKQFIYTSTGGVYTGGESPFFENHPLEFNAASGFYPGSKYMSELLVQNYRAIFNTIIFRPFFIYGKRQKREMLIPRLVDHIKSGSEIRIEGSTGLRVNPIHVSDAAHAIIRSLNLEGSQIFNLGGSEVLSLKEICDIIALKLNKTVNFTFAENTIPKDMFGDITRLTEMLGKPQKHFEVGVEDLLIYEE